MSDWSNPTDPAKDDAFAALFRPEDDSVGEAVVDVEPSGVVEIEVEDGFVDDAPFAASPVLSADVQELDVVGEGVVATETRAASSDTGRLFRSARAESTEAIAAVPASQVSRLRTLTPADAPTAAVTAVGAPIAINSLLPPPPAEEPMREERSRRERASRSDRDAERESSSARMPALTLGKDMPPVAAYAFVIIVTLIFGLIDAMLGDGLGFLTGIALLFATLYTALRIRVSDAIVPVLAAPIAFFIAAITVGQLNPGSAGDSTTGRAVLFLFNLGNNWLWIFGATILALIIMVIRRRRG